MAPKVYVAQMSPPCRTVLTVIKALDIEVDLEDVPPTFMKSPEMLEINPQHTIPTLVDEDFVVWDSHAISIYLISVYSPDDDSLYPKDPKQRAIVDQRLYFETGVLFNRFVNAMRPLMRGESTEISDTTFEELMEAYQFLNAFLENNDWLAGDEVTLADISMLSTMSTLDLIVPVEEEKYPKLFDWLKRGKQLPYFEESQSKGLDMIKAFVEEKMGM